MKARVIFAAVLVVAIALVGCVAPQPQQPSAAKPVEGVQVAAQTIQVRDEAENVLFDIEPTGKVSSTPNLFWDGKFIYRGQNDKGEKLFTVENNKLYVGPNTQGTVAYSFDNGKILEGVKGSILYNFSGDGRKLFQGATGGTIQFQASDDLQPFWGVLVVLAEKRAE